MKPENVSLPRVSVVVPTYNRPDLLRQAISSVLAQDYPLERFEVLIIDNNSGPETRRVVESYASSSPAPRWILETKQGLQHARNRGIREAAGEVIVFVDDDIIAEAGWLKRMASAFADSSQGRVAGVGGTVVPVLPGPCPPWLHQWSVPYRFGEALHVLKTNQFPMGANMALARWVFDEVGGFRPGLGRTGKELLAGEESELFHRVRLAGHAVWFEPRAVVRHIIEPSRFTFGYGCRHAFDSARSRVMGKVKYESSGVREALLFLASRFAGSVLRLPLLLLLATLWLLVFQLDQSQASLVRACRAAGYLVATTRAFLHGDWRRDFRGEATIEK